MAERLQKILSARGVASRRKAEEMIQNGLVTVNGITARLGDTADPVTDEIAQRYLSVLIDSGIDTLILGCTHYPLIRSTIGSIMGEGVTLVNPAYETAVALKNLLAEKNLLNEVTPPLGSNPYQFYVSDGAEKFKQFANSIIKYGILSAKTINIEEY